MRQWHYARYIAVDKLCIHPFSHGSNIVVGGGQSMKHELNIQYAKQWLLEEVFERT